MRVIQPRNNVPPLELLLVELKHSDFVVKFRSVWRINRHIIRVLGVPGADNLTDKCSTRTPGSGLGPTGALYPKYLVCVGALNKRISLESPKYSDSFDGSILKACALVSRPNYN